MWHVTLNKGEKQVQGIQATCNYREGSHQLFSQEQMTFIERHDLPLEDPYLTSIGWRNFYGHIHKR